MALTRDVVEELGFDPELARDSLATWLIEHATNLDQDAIDNWKAVTAGDMQTGRRWTAAFDLAIVNAERHSLTAEVNGVVVNDGSGIRTKVDAASVALIELHLWYGEFSDDGLHYVRLLGQLLEKLHTIPTEPLNDLRAFLLDKHEVTKSDAFGTRPDHFARTLSNIESLSACIGHLENEHERARGRLLGPHSRLSSAAPGPARQVLLASIWQHLRWGGFSYNEVAQLAPDTNPHRVADAAGERVRKRLDKSPDSRALKPEKAE